MLLLLLLYHLPVSFPRPDPPTPTTRGRIVTQAAIVMAAGWVRVVAHDSVEAQVEMAKKPGDECSGRGELLLSQRKTRIVRAKLAWCPRDVLDAHRHTVSPAVMPGPVFQLHELHYLARAAHDEVRRSLRPGLLETLYTTVYPRLPVRDVDDDQRYRFAPTAAVVR